MDFVNTLDWRDDPAQRVERLSSPQALSSWIRHAGFGAAAGSSTRFARSGQAQPARAIRLREALATIFRAVVDGRTPPPPARVTFTKWTQEAWRHRELVDDRGALSWGWQIRTDPIDRVLFELVLEAGTLLLSSDRNRIGVCAGEGCGWFFVDRSKAGRRRWCSMAACGNRVKVREYRKRAAPVLSERTARARVEGPARARVEGHD
jgi:predicted RNA-binding Zn ribbon-like protein